MLCMLLFLREDEVYKLDLFPFIGNHPLLGTTSVQPLYSPLTHNSNSGNSYICTSVLEFPLRHLYCFLHNLEKCRLTRFEVFNLSASDGELWYLRLKKCALYWCSSLLFRYNYVQVISRFFHIQTHLNIIPDFFHKISGIVFYCCTLHSDICTVHSPKNSLLLI